MKLEKKKKWSYINRLITHQAIYRFKRSKQGTESRKRKEDEIRKNAAKT
jgi:hypothetical protein